MFKELQEKENLFQHYLIQQFNFLKFKLKGLWRFFLIVNYSFNMPMDLPLNLNSKEM